MRRPWPARQRRASVGAKRCQSRSHGHQERSLNVDDLVAIDVHTHAEVSERGQGSLSAELQQASRALFKADRVVPTLPEIAAYYRERQMACVVFTVDAETTTGIPGVPNEEVARA